MIWRRMGKLASRPRQSKHTYQRDTDLDVVVIYNIDAPDLDYVVYCESSGREKGVIQTNKSPSTTY